MAWWRKFICSQPHPWRIISQSGQQGQQIPVSTQALIKLFSKLSCFQSWSLLFFVTDVLSHFRIVNTGYRTPCSCASKHVCSHAYLACTGFNAALLVMIFLILVKALVSSEQYLWYGMKMICWHIRKVQHSYSKVLDMVVKDGEYSPSISNDS